MRVLSVGGKVEHTSRFGFGYYAESEGQAYYSRKVGREVFCGDVIGSGYLLTLQDEDANEVDWPEIELVGQVADMIKGRLQWKG